MGAGCSCELGLQEAFGEPEPAEVQLGPRRDPLCLRHLPGGPQCITTSRIMASIQSLLPGQKVPADVRLIEVDDGLRFDRSMLTGEVCTKTRLRTHDRNHFSTLSHSRVNRSLDAWESQMITSSRWDAPCPGPFAPNMYFRCSGSSDKQQK